MMSAARTSRQVPGDNTRLCGQDAQFHHRIEFDADGRPMFQAPIPAALYPIDPEPCVRRKQSWRTSTPGRRITFLRRGRYVLMENPISLSVFAWSVLLGKSANNQKSQQLSGQFIRPKSHKNPKFIEQLLLLSRRCRCDR